MLFWRLKGRRVLVNTTTGETFRGTVLSRGLRYVRLSSVDVQVPGHSGPIDGIARIPHRIITWIQEI